MDASTRAPGYDLFKLIVAIFLLILAIALMWGSPSQTDILPPATSSPIPPSTETKVSELTATPPPPAPTETKAPKLTATHLPPPTATKTSEPTATPLPSPPETLVPEATASPAPEASAGTVCEIAASRSRLQIGENATILRRLNFRSSPGIRDNWLLTNSPGTQVKVVGGAECIPYWTGAYLWWQIRLPDGRIGWSAENSLQGSFYFMEPE